MADILTPKQRSALMARIRSAGNASTELRLVALLRAGGITGWRRGVRLKRQVTGDKWQGAGGGGVPVDSGRLPVGGKDSPRSAQSARSSGKEARSSSPVLSVRSVAQSCRPSSAIGRPLTVKPDFVFRKERLVVFVDGCFWHGCLRHYTRPKARRAFWDAKIAANRARDRRIDRALRAAGWRVLHVWEHALAPRQLGRTLARVRRRLRLPV